MTARSGVLPLAVLAAALCSLSGETAPAQTDSSHRALKSWTDSLQTFEQYVMSHLRELKPPGLKEQQRRRQEFQQRGYGEVLLDVIRRDGLSALISYLKFNLWIEYSMPHRVYWIVPPQAALGSVIPGIPYPDDWSMPEDPWIKD